MVVYAKRVRQLCTSDGGEAKDLCMYTTKVLALIAQIRSVRMKAFSILLVHPSAA